LPRHGDGPRRLHGPHGRSRHVEGQLRADGALGPRPADPGQDRRVGDHRARLRIRCLRIHEVRGTRAARRNLAALGQQDVHHQRTLRGHHRLHLQARGGGRRPPRLEGDELRARPGHARAHPDQGAAQDGPAQLPDGRALPAGRPGRGRSPARRQGPQPRGVGRQGHLLDGALGGGRHGARDRGALPRALGPVRARAGAVRPRA
jgi:hypothetical protein